MSEEKLFGQKKPSQFGHTPFLGVSVILFYCDKLSYRIGHNLLQLILSPLLTCICIIHIVYIMTAKHIQHSIMNKKLMKES
jgi:ATP/ADP translocase